ncbi:protein ZNF365 [Chanos chanos]|uniref:Protein ZNF365 n=1 Tax=Chanos chanos TaxID=29144 RepID=A0A6J2WHS5_CHACN|nr:protein ZNF365 [Chanos chanos]
MQQKLCTRSTSLFVENGKACGAGAPLQLPFRCPRCGEQKRFNSLASLRAHLEYSHTYHTRLDLSLPNTRGHSHIDITLPGEQSAHDTGLDKSADGKNQTTRDAGTDTNTTEKGEGKLKSSISADPDPCPAQPPDPSPGQSGLSPQSNCRGVEVRAGVGPCCAPVTMVGQRLEGMLRVADSSMERRLLRLSSELAQTDTALLCERAHSHHLAREKQEMLEREQALSKQVDSAVMVIATLRQQLSMSEHELERKEQEVISIQNFLEVAAQHEMCGKVRLRHFIENLLRRIALAERLLEYYRTAPHRQHCPAHPVSPPADHGSHRITKSR